MAITGAARKQAGLYYDKGGTEFNVRHPDFGATGLGVVAEQTAIQAALTAASGVGVTRVPAGVYKMGSGVTIPDNTHLVIDDGALFQMTTRFDALFTATSKSNLHISGRGKVKGSNTSIGPTQQETLFRFDTCSDVSLVDVQLSETCTGAWFSDCTNIDFNCRVRDILHRTDLSQGYGILLTLASYDWRIGGHFTNIGRHAIYVGAGASNGVISHFTIDGCDSVGVDINTFDTESTSNNIVISNGSIRDIGRGSALPKKNGIAVFGNASNITIGEGIVIDDVDGDGISIEGTDTYTPDTNPRGIHIASPVISNTGGKGILVVNSKDVTFDNPTIRLSAASGIHISTVGTGTGSLTNGVVLPAYVIDTPTTYGITIAEQSSGQTTNVVLGRGVIKSAGTGPFNIVTTSPVFLNWPGVDMDYSELALATSQTDNPFVANPATAYWIAPADGFLVALTGRLSAAPTAGNLTVRASRNGVGLSFLTVPLVTGSLDFEKTLPPGVGGQPVVKGEQIGVMYTTDAGFLPNGTRNCVAQLRFVQYP